MTNIAEVKRMVVSGRTRMTPSEAFVETLVAQGVSEVFGIVGGGGYVNYIEATMPNWARAYYGDNLTRLRQIALRYDPDRLFSFPQAIASA